MAITDDKGICNLAMHRLGAEKVSDVTTTPTSAEEIACNDIYEQTRDEMLQGIFAIAEIGSYNWQFAKRHAQLIKAQGYDETDGWDEQTITNITQADPAVVTIAGHGFGSGWTIYIDNVEGMTEINKMYVRATSVLTDSFECYGLDSTLFTAYTTGGTAIRREPLSGFADGYVYDAPVHMLKPISLENKDSHFELVGSGDTKRIISDEEDPILIYIIQLPTVTEFTIGFIRALAGRIAYELAPSLSEKKVGEIYEMYKVDVYDAIAADASSVTPGSLITEDNRIVDEGGWG